MVKSKGFTLAELIAVIVILGIIGLIAVPTVNTLLKKSKENLYENQVKMIEQNSKKWSIDNINELSETETVYLNLSELIESGYIEQNELKDPRNSNQTMNGCVLIQYDNEYSKYEYNYDERTCYEIDPIYANKPELTTGMIAVKWYNGNWVKADTNNKEGNNQWYDYNNQMWANAVTVTSTNRTTLLNAAIGTVIPMSDINTMWVWIPRYKYQLFDTPADLLNPPSIEIIFEDKNTKTVPTSPYTTGDWLTHPAFTFGTTDVSGIWVGKFETSTNDTTCYNTPSYTDCEDVDPVIKPNVSSLRYQNVSTQFATAQKFNNNTKYGFSTDGNIHMAKDSEWGAVAYLSQSQYGKHGNSMYTGANKEIYQNKSNGYITGSSNGTPSQSTTITSQCVYNDIEDRVDGTGACGAGASTTGNIYGVYDMSGGAWEYTMSMYRPTDATPVTDNSGFGATTTLGNLPTSEYWDRYTGPVATACSGGICYGSALSETGGWYSDFAGFVFSSGPWSVRGGVYGDATYAGAFYFSNLAGGAYSNGSFRVVQLKP